MQAEGSEAICRVIDSSPRRRMIRVVRPTSMPPGIATKQLLIGSLVGVLAASGVVIAYKSLLVYPTVLVPIAHYDPSLLRPFQRATSFRVLALDPTHYRGSSSRESPTSAAPFRPVFHDYDVVGDTGFIEASDLPRFLSDLDALYARNRIDWACFTPHHGIQVSDGESTYDLVVCFECSKAHIYVDGTGPSVISFGVSDSPRLDQRPLDRLIQSHSH